MSIAKKVRPLCALPALALCLVFSGRSQAEASTFSGTVQIQVVTPNGVCALIAEHTSSGGYSYNRDCSQVGVWVQYQPPFPGALQWAGATVTTSPTAFQATPFGATMVNSRHRGCGFACSGWINRH
jgi:hypothetical protein